MERAPSEDNESCNISKLNCAAETLSQYCPSCASGSSCCSSQPLPDKMQDESPAADNDSINQRIEEAVEAFKQKHKSKKDRGNRDQMSDGEIAKRLFGGCNLEPPLNEGPLDVIIEINGEEDDFANSERLQLQSSDNVHRLHSSLSSVSKITENYVINSKYSSFANDVETVTLNTPSQSDGSLSLQCSPSKFTTFQERQSTDHQGITSYEPILLKNTKSSADNGRGSYNKANKLISEIESCFTETTSLVEKTLQASHFSNSQLNHKNNTVHYNQQNVSSPFVETNSNTTNNNEDSYGKTQQIRQSVEEAITLFDSIINENPKYQSNNCLNDSLYPEEIVNDTSSSNIKNDLCDSLKLKSTSSWADQIDDITNNISDLESNDNYRRSEESITELGKSKRRNSFRMSLFDAEIDELFKDCYDLAAIEPSTSLDSCLKNLESLCYQLKKARNRLLGEMKLGQDISEFSNCENLDDELYKEALSLLHHDRFSLINEVIEQKVNKKRSKKKFSLDPPLMGLEGRTHKRIAEVTPKNLGIENEATEENGYFLDLSDNLSNSMFFESGSSFGSRNSFAEQNHSYRPEFSSFDDSYDLNNITSTSHATFNTNHLDDSSSYSDNLNNSDHLNSSRDDKSSIMSQEETLALYADNQELQESLLSILHSLNDIHNNFLKRRKMESEQSHQSSLRIHNKILSVLSTGSQLEKKKIAHDYVNIPMSLNSSRRNSFEDDFEAIDKIIKVSEELKNLWLSHTPDFTVKRRLPSRTKSFSSRFDQKYKTSKLRRNLNKTHTLRNSCDDISASSMNKCYSMPNLIAIDLDTPTEERLVNFPQTADNQFYFSNSILKERHQEEVSPSIGVKNFIKQLKIENEKCYAITLNFLKRIMEVCKDIEESEGIRKAHLQTPHQQACIASF